MTTKNAGWSTYTLIQPFTVAWLSMPRMCEHLPQSSTRALVTRFKIFPLEYIGMLSGRTACHWFWPARRYNSLWHPGKRRKHIVQCSCYRSFENTHRQTDVKYNYGNLAETLTMWEHSASVDQTTRNVWLLPLDTLSVLMVIMWSIADRLASCPAHELNP